MRKPPVPVDVETETLIQEMLDSDGWHRAKTVFARTINKLRKRVFDGDGTSTQVDISTLRNIKVMLVDLYTAGGIDLPYDLIALFE